MAFIRKATDNPFGFMPYGRVLRASIYRKDASASAVYPGDVVVMESDGNIAASGASTAAQIGVAAQYSAASTAEDVLVYDHPDQLFTGQDDNDTTHMAETNIGNCADLVATTGDTTLLHSRQEIDSSTADTTATRALKIVALHPIEERGFVSAAAAGNQRKWVVKLNSHMLGGVESSAATV